MKRADEFRELRNEINKQHPGGLALPSNAAVGSYHDAIERYRDDGDRRALMESLMALGIEADWIRWHVDNRGAMVVSYVSL